MVWLWRLFARCLWTEFSNNTDSSIGSTLSALVSIASLDARASLCECVCAVERAEATNCECSHVLVDGRMRPERMIEMKKTMSADSSPRYRNTGHPHRAASYLRALPTLLTLFLFCSANRIEMFPILFSRI